MRENDIVVQQVALGVQAHHLAAGAESGVDGHHALLPHRGRQQQLTQVFAEDLDGFDIGLFLGLSDDLAGDGGVQKALPSVIHSFAHFLMIGVTVLLAIVVIEFVAALFSVGVNLHFQEAFFLGTEHGQQVVGRDFGNGLGEVEVTAVLGGLRIGHALLGHFGAHTAGAVDAT